MRLHQRLVSIFGGIRKAVATYLDEQAINAACREEKYTWRERLFNPTNTVHLFILQTLNRNTALNDLPRKSHESFTGSAFCKARQRLPLRVFQRLLRSLAETLLPHPGGERIDKEGRWCGHRTFIMDGSSCSMPDTPELQRHFGQPGNQRPGGDRSRIHPAHPPDRRGKEGLRPIAGPQAAAMGGRADVRMAVEVPRDPGAVRQEGHQLPRADSAGLRTVLVSQAPPHGSM